MGGLTPFRLTGLFDLGFRPQTEYVAGLIAEGDVGTARAVVVRVENVAEVYTEYPSAISLVQSSVKVAHGERLF